MEKKTLSDKKKQNVSSDKLVTQGSGHSSDSMDMTDTLVTNGEATPNTESELIETGYTYEVRFEEPVEGSYSERNIDEEIEKREQEQRDFEYAQMLASQTSSSIVSSQNEESTTTTTQAGAETEFKVVQKKKKGHKEKTAAVSVLTAAGQQADKQAATSQNLNKSRSSKPSNSEMVRNATVPTAPKLTDVQSNIENKKSEASESASEKLHTTQATSSSSSDGVKTNKTSQYDLSEFSFPSLSSNVSKVKATATVAPFSYAAKAKSSAKPVVEVSPLEHTQDAVQSLASAAYYDKELQHNTPSTNTLTQIKSEVTNNNSNDYTSTIPQSDGANPTGSVNNTHELFTQTPVTVMDNTMASSVKTTVSMPKTNPKDSVQFKNQLTKQSRPVEFVGFYDRPNLDIKFGFDNEEPDGSVDESDNLNQLTNQITPSAEQSLCNTANQEMISEDRQSDDTYKVVNLLEYILNLPSEEYFTQPREYNGSFNLERTVNLLRKGKKLLTTNQKVYLILSVVLTVHVKKRHVLIFYSSTDLSALCCSMACSTNIINY